jgi:hypothetical protein
LIEGSRPPPSTPQHLLAPVPPSLPASLRAFPPAHPLIHRGAFCAQVWK